MKTLAWILIAVSVSLPATFARTQTNGSQSATTDNEPVMFTLTIDEEMMKALREGQSLMSTIPASIRGKVDRIRIEFKPAAAPASQPSQNNNSILNRNTDLGTLNRSGDNTLGQQTGIQSSPPPPLRPPNLNNGLDRSSGNPQQEFAAPKLTDSVWNRAPASAARSSSSLTPIDQSTRGWLFQNRSDSNATVSTNSNQGGILPLPPPGNNYPLNRTAFEDPPPAAGLYSGPPAYSRSLPALDTSINSSEILASSPITNSLAADNTPTVGSNQVLSKPPAAESSGRQPLASGDAADARRQDRTQVYVFMLLLCSLGLNVYLGWISRGFYVRYQELAGELRETFTPSSAA